MTRYLRLFVEAFRQRVEDYQTSNHLNPPGGSGVGYQKGDFF